MAISIDTVKLETDTLSVRSSSALDVFVSGDTPVGVVAVINGQIIPLGHRGGGHWFKQLHPIFIGECTAEPIYLYAFDGNGVATDNSLTISVSGDVPDDPLQFTIDLIEAEWDPSLYGGVPCPKLMKVWEIKRYNKCDFNYVLFIEEEREVDQKARGHYKTVKFPQLLEIHSTKWSDAKWILYGVQKIIEKYHGTVDSPLYNYYELRNEAKNFSTFQNFKFAYSVALVSNYRYLEDV